MNRKTIASLTILIASLNVKAAKLVFASEKTPTYNKIDEKFIKYVKYKNQAVEYSDGIGITDGTLDFENLEMYAGYKEKPKLWVYDGWKTNSYVKSSEYSGGHLVEVYRAFSLGAGGIGKYKDNIYSTVLIAESPLLPKGLFSSSYTIQDDYRHYLGKNSIYFGNVINEIAVGDVASPRFYSGKTTDNNWLIFQSMGNPVRANSKDWIVKNTDGTLINTVIPTFETIHFGMYGEEVQKLIRSEKVRVGQYACSRDEYQNSVKDITSLITESIRKNVRTDTAAGLGEVMDNGKKEELCCVFPAAKKDSIVYPLYSRANSVYENGQVMRFQKGNKLKMDDGSIIPDWTIVSGTSYSSPRITGGARQVAELFPGITYHEVKQFIFTTASRENDNLDNILGWGIADIGKAKRGIASLNAGLVEEQKFFTGMYDRVKGKDGMPFFWAEIQEGKEWNWYNDIQGSMAKKPQGKTCYNMLVDTVDKNTGYTNATGEKNAVIEIMCIQNFIPSEKNFYRDINDIETLTGLRKAGKGRLNIFGKVEIDGVIQVLEGEMNIYSDVNTEIEIYENSKILVNSDKNRKINIKKMAVLGGNIDLKGNVNIGEMYLENGELKNISAEGNVIVRKLYVKNRKQIEKLKKYLDSNKLFTVREFGVDSKNYENVVINPDKTMDIPREYFMSNFENEIIGYSVNSEIYDKLVKKYGRIDGMPENIKEIVPGYSKGIFRLDVDSDTDSFSKEDFVNGTGNYIKNAQEMVKTLNKKYYFIRQD